jgi:thiamine kinase-like enzyme
MDITALGEFVLEDVAKEYGCATLCHGDVWSGNLLIEKNEDGSISDRILGIIDWQTVFEGRESLCFGWGR